MVSSTAAQIFERAVQCHRAGNAAEAEALYRMVLLEAPGHHPSLHLLSTLALQAGRPTDAAAMLERAVELAPEQAVYHANLGEVYRRLGLLPEAALSLSRALAIQPDLAERVIHRIIGALCAPQAMPLGDASLPPSWPAGRRHGSTRAYVRIPC